MREIPSLHTLCLRSIGSHSCSAEDTFASTSRRPSKKGSKGEEDKTDNSNEHNHHPPCTASRLLRSFHQRKCTTLPLYLALDKVTAPETMDDNSIAHIPLARMPCIGPGSARRVQANEVDLHHPFIGCRLHVLDGTSSKTVENQDPLLYMVHGNAALDCLQSYIDSLVEMGRMDDGRLGRHFFEEWKANVIIADGGDTVPGGNDPELEEEQATPSKRRRTTKNNSSTQSDTDDKKTPLGALSLHNCTIGDETFEHMVDADIGPYLAILDFTGVRGLTDDLMGRLLPKCTNLQAISLKNCRRITSLTLDLLGKHQKKLEMLDVGGATNMTAYQVLDVLSSKPKKLPNLNELHASGLGWSDESMSELVSLEGREWKSLSLSFSLDRLTHTGLRQNLVQVASTLKSLALAFCEGLVDNAAMGLLGRNLPHVVSLDVRGNPQLSTLTGWYDGRVSADLPVQPLTVLARYTSLSEASIEETKRVHPLEANDLLVIMDGGGMGAGITRTEFLGDGAESSGDDAEESQ